MHFYLENSLMLHPTLSGQRFGLLSYLFPVQSRDQWTYRSFALRAMNTTYNSKRNLPSEESRKTKRT